MFFVANEKYHSGIGLVYNNGESCNDRELFSTVVNVACDVTAGTGELYYVYQASTCRWVYEYVVNYVKFLRLTTYVDLSQFMVVEFKSEEIKRLVHLLSPFPNFVIVGFRRIASQ